MRAILQHIHPAFHVFMVAVLLVFGVRWTAEELRVRVLAEDMLIVQQARETAPQWAKKMFPGEAVFCLRNMQALYQRPVYFGASGYDVVLVVGEGTHEYQSTTNTKMKGCADAGELDWDYVWYLAGDHRRRLPERLAPHD
ncbi:MAG: hypothetical protein AAGC81_14505 [Pseudomonadota bacterium]